MMEGSWRKGQQGTQRSAVKIAALVLGVAALVFLAPYIRDAAGSLLAAKEDAAYGAVPRAVLTQRLRTAELEIERTRYQAVLYQHLMDRYTDLRVEAGARPPEAYITARVVARPPQTHYDTLVLAAGSADGIRVGDWASIEMVYLGTVQSVSAHSATVLLASAPGSTEDATLDDPAAILVLTGEGGGAFSAQAPVALTVVPGAAVYDGESGMVIAVVADAVHAPTDVAQTVHLSSPASIASLREVSLTHQP